MYFGVTHLESTLLNTHLSPTLACTLQVVLGWGWAVMAFPSSSSMSSSKGGTRGWGGGLKPSQSSESCIRSSLCSILTLSLMPLTTGHSPTPSPPQTPVPLGCLHSFLSSSATRATTVQGHFSLSGTAHPVLNRTEKWPYVFVGYALQHISYLHGFIVTQTTQILGFAGYYATALFSTLNKS